MTICIAAICQENGEPRIVLCSDTRLSYGDWGASTDRAAKIDVVGRGWVVQFAERPDSSKELIRRIREWFHAASNLDTVHAALTALDGAVKEFRSSPLCVPGCCQLLVTGFAQREPVIFSVADDDKKKVAVSVAEPFTTIGCGSVIARIILNCREYTCAESLENSLYMVYEAKRFSEKAGDVGPITAMYVQAPGAEGKPNRAALKVLRHPVGVAGLEMIFNKVGLKQKLNINPYPSEMFIEGGPTDPRSPTDDPPLPLPWQE